MVLFWILVEWNTSKLVDFFCGKLILGDSEFGNIYCYCKDIKLLCISNVLLPRKKMNKIKFKESLK